MRYLTLLPLLALLACSESTTAPTETPDPFWSGTKPAVRVTVLEGTKDAPATDRVGRVRIDVLWDSAWTPGAKDRRLLIDAMDSSFRAATGADLYLGGGDTLSGPGPTAAVLQYNLAKRTLTVEHDVYCPGKLDRVSVGMYLVQNELDVVEVIRAGGDPTVYCAVPR